MNRKDVHFGVIKLSLPVSGGKGEWKSLLPLILHGEDLDETNAERGGTSDTQS